MEIDLPGRGEAVCGTGIQQVTGTVVPAEIADVLDEDVGTRPDLLLDDEGGLDETLLSGSEGAKNVENMPLTPHPAPSSRDQGNCRYGRTPRPATAVAPVGSPTPAVAERLTSPGNGPSCHLTPGARSENPELAPPCVAPT